MTSMVKVAGFMRNEMTKNALSGTTKTIASYNDSVLDFYKAANLWKSWVGNRKPWDHKRSIRTLFGEWAYDDASNRRYNYDIWSNLHFGYVGRAGKFGAWTLKAGAGAAQLAAGTAPDGYWERRFDNVGDADFLAAFDDPKDQAAIVLGISLWDSYGTGLTLGQLLEGCRNMATMLNTLAGAK